MSHKRLKLPVLSVTRVVCCQVLYTAISKKVVVQNP